MTMNLHLAFLGRFITDDDFTEFIVSVYHGGPECHTMIDTLGVCGYSLLRLGYSSHSQDDNDENKEITSDDDED